MDIIEVNQGPNIREAASKLSSYITMRAWIIMLGNCVMEYEGRAASRTTPGDRLVVIKPDGSVLVHGPRGFKPTNWQPDTSAIVVSGEDTLIIRAIRRSPREVLIIECRKVYLLAAGIGAEEGSFWMYVNEHEIRDIITRKPELVEEGLRIVRVEKPVEPGFIDLYAKDREGRLVVIELKRVKAGEDAARQLIRYIEYFRSKGVEPRGILVAPEATDTAISLLERAGLEFKRIDLRKIYSLIRDSSRAKKPSILDYL
ncbi:MAG: endonuclease NucS [Desulfurococcales archaeon]|nr:endonuclease NucS [Desulfurococcales archaeon]